MKQFEKYIEINTEKRFGKPIIKDTRISVYDILLWLSNGMTKEEIINDLGKNKSTNDIESLYEIQKIKEPKEQVSLYFDFVSKKIDRKALREHNKIKVSHAKEKPYIIENRAKKIKIEFNVTSFTDEEVKEINERLKEVLESYIK